MKIIALLLALGLGAGGFVAPGVLTAPQEGEVAILAAPAAAGLLRPGQPVLVSGIISNNTDRALDAGTATVHISAAKLESRAALEQWTAGVSPASGAPIGDSLGEARIGELASGQSRSFTITIPASSLGFISGALSVYPLEVRLATDQLTIATQRSTISWVPDGQAPQLGLAIVAPLSAPAASTGLLDAAALELLTSPGGTLFEQLAAATSHSIAIGVDPMIVASIRLLGDLAPKSAVDWLQRIEHTSNDTFALSYADSDQLLLHRAGATAPLEPLTFPHEDSENPAPSVSDTPSPSPMTPPSDGGLAPGNPLSFHTTISGLAWPASSPTSEDELDFLAKEGSTRTLISSDSVTGSVLSTPNLMVNDHSVTVSDAQVSLALSLAAKASTENEWAIAVAKLTAWVTATAAGNPGAVLVATLSRDSAANTRMVSSTLTAIQSSALVRSVSLSSAMGFAPVAGSITEPKGEDGAVDRVPLAKSLLASEASLASFSSVADDPTLITGPQRLDLLALTSASWANDFAAWSAAVGDHLALNLATLSSVHLPESSSITFLQERGNLPIAVRNELDFPVTVFVTVRPERAILTVSDNRVELKIEANSQAKASIPVQSIANGEVQAEVSLTSTTGVTISEPKTIILNVQAGWETTATVVLAIIVVALFAAGVWRTVLRRRNAKKARNADGQEAQP